jgi:hypothetical protein
MRIKQQRRGSEDLTMKETGPKEQVLWLGGRVVMALWKRSFEGARIVSHDDMASGGRWVEVASHAYASNLKWSLVMTETY